MSLNEISVRIDGSPEALEEVRLIMESQPGVWTKLQGYRLNSGGLDTAKDWIVLTAPIISAAVSILALTKRSKRIFKFHYQDGRIVEGINCTEKQFMQMVADLKKITVEDLPPEPGTILGYQHPKGPPEK